MYVLRDFYVQIRDVSSTCLEMQGCISMYGYRMYLAHVQNYRDVILCAIYCTVTSIEAPMLPVPMIPNSTDCPGARFVFHSRGVIT